MNCSPYHEEQILFLFESLASIVIDLLKIMQTSISADNAFFFRVIKTAVPGEPRGLNFFKKYF
jgi:hypothetical protein